MKLTQTPPQIFQQMQQLTLGSASVGRLFSIDSEVMKPKRSSLNSENFERFLLLMGNSHHLMTVLSAPIDVQEKSRLQKCYGAEDKRYLWRGAEEDGSIPSNERDFQFIVLQLSTDKCLQKSSTKV